MVKKLVLFCSLVTASFAVTVPRPAGDVPLTFPGKPAGSISKYKGRPVLLAVFITTCPHCQRTTKLLNAIQKDYKAQGLQVLEVAFRDEDNDAALKKFAKDYAVNFPVGHIDGERLVEFAQITNDMRPTVPMLFFIDRQGIIRGQYFGNDPFIIDEKNQDENMRAKLLPLLAPVKSAAKKP